MFDIRRGVIQVERLTGGSYNIRHTHPGGTCILKTIKKHDSKSVRAKANRIAMELGEQNGGLLVLPYKACKDCRADNIPQYMVKSWIWDMAHHKEEWPSWSVRRWSGDILWGQGELCWDCLESRCEGVISAFRLDWNHFTNCSENMGETHGQFRNWLHPCE